MNDDYSFLNITNLTTTPYEDIHSKLDNAIQQHDDYKYCTGSHEAMHEALDEMLDDFAEYGRVKGLSEFVDNLIVNFDYYAFVEEHKFNT